MRSRLLGIQHSPFPGQRLSWLIRPVGALSTCNLLSSKLVPQPMRNLVLVLSRYCISRPRVYCCALVYVDSLVRSSLIREAVEKTCMNPPYVEKFVVCSQISIWIVTGLG